MHTVVLGAGISGLVCALELQRRGVDVTVIEKACVPGGLSRTIEHEGYRFDLGGHRFHSNNPEVVNWLTALLPNDLLRVKRQSRIRINEDFVDYPLQLPSALNAFSPMRSIGMASSYLAARATFAFRPDVTFEDWVVKRFGRGLFDVFFRPYTEKVWGLPCDGISADWASQRIGLPSLTRALRQAMLPHEKRLPTSAAEFLYPRLGFGMIIDAMVNELVEGGGRLSTSTRPLSVRAGEESIEIEVEDADGRIESIGGDFLISTVPPAALLGLLAPRDDDAARLAETWELKYRDLLCVFLEIDLPQVSADHWTYFPESSLRIGRTHEPGNWSAEMVPRGDRTSLVVEIFASRGDSVWAMDDASIAALCASELESVGFLPSGRVRASKVVRVGHAYPVYGLGYEKPLAEFQKTVAKYPRLLLAGRTGTFRYMNSDGVIEDAMDVASRIMPLADEPVHALVEQAERWA